MDLINQKNEILRYHIDNPGTIHHSWNDGWEYWSILGKAISQIDKYFKRARVFAYTKEKWGCYRVSILGMYDGTLKSILQPSVRMNFEWWYYGQMLRNLYDIKDRHKTSRFYDVYVSIGLLAENTNEFIKNRIVPMVNKVLSILSDIDRFIAYPHLPFYYETKFSKEGIKHPTLYKIDQFIRNKVRFIPKCFINWVQKKQEQKINEGFQKVCLEYPQIVHELVSDIDCYKWIKPYGDYILDGTEIHNKHWIPIK